jgi:hypothetical protein
MIDDRHHGPHYSQPADFSAAPDVHNKNPRMKIRGKGAGLCVKKLGTQRANVNSRPGEKCGFAQAIGCDDGEIAVWKNEGAASCGTLAGRSAFHRGFPS